ncbi:diguanylate cyclase [Halothiobacillus diazotrophicus]|uniref:Diguanylate cyclase n=1 Tax=Halothiobacillus diazotrophicus TaxID=1860122 RepID=A0A191ZJK2_9GAMM|nr:sensor domain-containing diguanylate cyclase [Halothiobacillus diazotrophicus]ANJ68045.1 diguanylate cyclase [Halothiobacillus diazotrophicus]
MKPPPIPTDERLRLDTLRSLNLLDTPPEERFDRLARLARRLFNVPISLVSLVDSDRQWFKSSMGLEVRETPREVSFCGHALLDDDVMVVHDALADDRFVDNPLVADDPYIRFYAGCPLSALNGSKLGTLCIIDHEPRRFDAEDRALLQDLAGMVEREIAALQLSTLDELTLISNRRGFMSLAQQSLNLCRRMQMPATLMSIDLNGFKEINDRFGHAEGDLALKAFADIMRHIFRVSDVFARLGGDEFVVLMSDVDQTAIDAVLTRFREAVEDYNATANRGYDLRYSVGYVPFDPNSSETIESLLCRADTHMYAEKRARKRDDHASSQSG